MMVITIVISNDNNNKAKPQNNKNTENRSTQNNNNFRIFHQTQASRFMPDKTLVSPKAPNSIRFLQEPLGITFRKEGNLLRKNFFIRYVCIEKRIAIPACQSIDTG